MEQQYKKKFLTDLAFLVVMGLIIYNSGRFLLSYLLPFVMASVIAFLVQKPAKKLSLRLGLKNGTCAVLILILVYILGIGIFAISGYRLVIGFKGFVEELPDFFMLFQKAITGIENVLLPIFKENSPELGNIISSFAEDIGKNLKLKLTNTVPEATAALAKKVPSFIFSSFVAVIASCYIAKDYSRLTVFLKELLGKRRYQNILKIKAILSNSVLKIVKGYLILMLITFAELTVGFFLLGFKHAPIKAFLVALIDLMPIFGTGTVLIPWSLILIITGNTKRGIMLLVVYGVITLIRNLLEPKIISKQTGISPLFILVAMFAGLRVFGALGFVLFPVTLIVVIKNYKNEMEQEKKG